MDMHPLLHVLLLLAGTLAVMAVSYALYRWSDVQQTPPRRPAASMDDPRCTGWMDLLYREAPRTVPMHYGSDFRYDHKGGHVRRMSDGEIVATVRVVPGSDRATRDQMGTLLADTLTVGLSLHDDEVTA